MIHAPSEDDAPSAAAALPGAGRARQPIGFIGLGVMGSAMASRLMARGYRLRVHSRTATTAAPLVAQGATYADTANGAASEADVVFLSLPDDSAVSSVVAAIVAGASLRPGAVIVDTSTTTPATARSAGAAVAQAGGSFLDAPVSGGQIGALEGTLAVMVGGPADALERVRPPLETLAREVIHVGPSGAGQIAKACNQLVVMATLEAVAEALMLAGASGVDPRRVLDALVVGYAGSRAMDVCGRRMLDHDFRPGGKASYHAKDVAILREISAQTGVPLALFEQLAPLVERLVALGGSELDHSALLLVLEEATGIKLGETRSVSHS